MFYLNFRRNGFEVNCSVNLSLNFLLTRKKESVKFYSTIPRWAKRGKTSLHCLTV